MIRECVSKLELIKHLQISLWIGVEYDYKKINYIKGKWSCKMTVEEKAKIIIKKYC